MPKKPIFKECAKNPAEFVKVMKHIKDNMSSEFGLAFSVFKYLQTPVITLQHPATMVDMTADGATTTIEFINYGRLHSDAIRRASKLQESLQAAEFLLLSPKLMDPTVARLVQEHDLYTKFYLLDTAPPPEIARSYAINLKEPTLGSKPAINPKAFAKEFVSKKLLQFLNLFRFLNQYFSLLAFQYVTDFCVAVIEDSLQASDL